MHQHERHAVIVNRARVATRIDVAELAEELEVTPETIRRDLTLLERRGLVRRVHGGAITVERLGFEPSVELRSAHHQAEKRLIATAALALVPDSGSILIDAGTTTMCLAEILPPEREFTVVTNSVLIAAVVARRGDLTVHLLGGLLRPRTMAAVGPWGVDALSDLHVDIAFLGTNGISIERGLTTPDQAEADTKRAMVAAAGQVAVLADSTKVGNAHFARFATLSQIDTFITDSGLDEETAGTLAAQGPEVVRA